MTNNILAGKRGIITGVANHNSIAWGIAKAAREQGAELAFTYQSEILKKRVEPLAKELGCDMLFECDAADENSIQNTFQGIGKRWDKIDFIVHAIAFADKNELRGRYLDTSLENFKNSLHISCYSLTAMIKYAEALMHKDASVVSLTYYGAEKVIPYYNVMGVAKAALETSIKYLANDLGGKNIRVNGVSAGPIRTLASSAIGDFKSMLTLHQETSPLKITPLT